jgi:hypothetical protein
MKRRGRITAEELMAELSKDPEYLARCAQLEAGRAAFHAKYADEDALISKEVAVVGYRIRSVWDFVNNQPHPVIDFPFCGPYERAYPILVRHLSVKHHPRVREGLIRALTVRDGGPIVWESLLAEFRKEAAPDMQWLLANALKVAMPYKLRRKHPEIAAAFKAPLRSNKSLERTRDR